MNYGEIFSKAWKTIWKHKVLWIFGLLASCGQGSGGGGGGGGGGTPGGGGGNGGNFNFERDFGNMNVPPWLENLARGLEQAAENGTLWVGMAGFILALIIFFLFLAILALVLSTIGKAGLVRGTWDVEEGAEKLAFGTLFKQSLGYFWKVLGFTILAWFGQLLLGFIAIFPIVLLTIITLGCGLLVLIPLLIAAGLFINVLIQFSIVAIVGEERGVFDSIERAWKLITRNLGPVAVITLIITVGTFVVGLLMFLPVLLIAVPVFLGFIQGGQAVTTGLIVGGGLMLIYILFAIFVSALLYAYLGAAWTLAFRALGKRDRELGAVVPPELPKPPVVEAKPAAKTEAPVVESKPAAATVKVASEEVEGKKAKAAETVKFTKEDLATKKLDEAGTVKLAKDEVPAEAKKTRRASKPAADEDLPKPD